MDGRSGAGSDCEGGLSLVLSRLPGLPSGSLGVRGIRMGAAGLLFSKKRPRKGKAGLLDLNTLSPSRMNAFVPCQHACIGCSMVADQVAHPAHLNARDTTLAFASRAPQKDIKRLKARMGWELIPWYTLTADFDKDFGVDEWHGTNAFIRDGDKVFRTYFINNRGDEQMGSTWNYLDITALGRQEEWEDSPEGYPQTPPYEWWTWHDEAR